MSKAKLYQSRNWLYRKYIVEKLGEKEIAEQAGTTQVTINRYLRKFNLKRKA